MRFLIILLVFISSNVFAQEDIVAREYFINGEFEKALISYQKLYEKNKNNRNYLLQLVKTEQQLELFNDAETRLIEAIAKRPTPSLFVELGYNYQLQNDSINANSNYNKAITSIETRANHAYTVGRAFENHSLLEQAIVTYTKAMELRPELDFNVQLANIYGEQGNIEKMFTSYLNLSEKNTTYLNTVKRAFSAFISEDSENENNQILKGILLRKIQKEPNLLWNEMLSWLFVQQKDYDKAFVQEKAIYKRQLESLDRIEELGLIARNDKTYKNTKRIFQYLVDTAQDIDIKLEAYHNLLEIETETASTRKELNTIDETYKNLFESYGKFSKTLDLQIAYAHFLAFNLNDTQQATTLLKEALNLKLSTFQKARVKLELGDILVLQEKFNEALIYYTQIQRRLKNSKISQEARFKVAKTSYYKGDFKWAESQLKILKASTSQLTANDALDLKLLISDNKQGDSLQTALKQYAKADLLSFQNKKEDAISLLSEILEAHKSDPIIAQTLLKQAMLYSDKAMHIQAEKNYNQLIANYPESILKDDALFALAELYEHHLTRPEKAKMLYEQIIFNHADSIYFVEARKRFRALRGDSIN